MLAIRIFLCDVSAFVCVSVSVGVYVCDRVRICAQQLVVGQGIGILRQ